MAAVYFNASRNLLMEKGQVNYYSFVTAKAFEAAPYFHHFITPSFPRSRGATEIGLHYGTFRLSFQGVRPASGRGVCRVGRGCMGGSPAIIDRNLRIYTAVHNATLKQCPRLAYLALKCCPEKNRFWPRVILSPIRWGYGRYFMPFVLSIDVEIGVKR